MKLRSLISSLVLCILTTFFVVSCTNPATNSGDNAQTTTPSTPTVRVSLGYSAWPGYFPWQIAQDENIFKENNVSVDLKWFDGYLESITTLTSEKIDANNQTLVDTVSSAAGGADQVIVLTNDISTGNDKIIAREGINSIADLKGKKVAAEEGTVDHFLLLLGMEKAGLSPKDIQFVPLETGKAATAFVGGQVDAVAVFAPFTTQALKLKGSKELFSSKEFPGAASDHLVLTRKFVDANPTQVQAMVDSWFDALEFIKTNPDRANEIMAKRAGVTVEEYKGYAEGTKILSIEENLKSFEEGKDWASMKYASREFSKFLINFGLTKTAPNIEKLFDDRFIKAYAAKKS